MNRCLMSFSGITSTVREYVSVPLWVTITLPLRCWQRVAQSVVSVAVSERVAD